MAFTNDILMRVMQTIKSIGGGINNKSFLMLGNQEMHLHEIMLDILEEANLIDNKADFSDEALEDSRLFFKTWGFKETYALDVSDYENADIIFNLNDDLPAEFEDKFDVVLDGGVIEHVFDIGNALMNICKMTKKDGYIININPIYNYIHNTFYNISPELFLDFYSANDYKIIECCMYTVLAEDRDARTWFERPIIWSPDYRLMQLIHPLYPGEHIRLYNKLCSNPFPHTYIVAQKINSNELVKPIVNGYAKKHKGLKEDIEPKTFKMRFK